MRKPSAVDVAMGLKLGYSRAATDSSPLREIREQISKTESREFLKIF